MLAVVRLEREGGWVVAQALTWVPDRRFSFYIPLAIDMFLGVLWFVVWLGAFSQLFLSFLHVCVRLTTRSHTTQVHSRVSMSFCELDIIHTFDSSQP